jgi:anti-sigma B factor antagonist
MNFSHNIINNNLHLSLSGDLMGETAGPGIIELAGESIKKGVHHCLVDISDVRYINSSGIGVLITLLTKFRNVGGDLYLINPSKHVEKLLIITKLQAIFNLVQTEQEALDRINH